MTGPLVFQIVLVVAMLVVSILARRMQPYAVTEQERRHWVLEQSIYMVGACLGLIIILGGSR